MAHAQKPDFVFRRNGRVHLNRRGRQFSRLLAAEVCASAVVMLDKLCSEVVWRVVDNHSIRRFPLHFPSRASPCAITFQLDSTFIPASFLWPSQREMPTCITHAPRSRFELAITPWPGELRTRVIVPAVRPSVKGKAIPLQTWTSPEGSRRLRLPDLKTVGTWRW